MKKHSMLCLGDSYTIGEGVSEAERFPVQTIALLQQKYKLHFGKPQIVATTGWTTDELIAAMKTAGLQKHYDCVTLLIGVNNQYRQRDPDNYRTEFGELLKEALRLAGNNRNHVFVLSIPDWGVTSFVAKDQHKRSTEIISAEIDRFNQVNREEAAREKVHYIDITPLSRLAATDHTLLAPDGLHPSGKMYTSWSLMLAAAIHANYTK